MSRAGGGINSSIINSVRSGGGGGGGSSGRLFGAATTNGSKDDTKNGLDRIFGKISLGDVASRNQGISRLMGAGPTIGNIDSMDDAPVNLDRIFGKLSLGDYASRNQGVSKLMGAAAPIAGDDFDDKKKIFGQISDMAPFRNRQQVMGAVVAPISIPIEERKKMMDYIAEIVGGNAVSNIQVQMPQGPQIKQGGGGGGGPQPGQVSQQDQGYNVGQIFGPPQGPQGLQGQGPQGRKQLDIYNQALQQLQKLQQEQQIVQERVNLLGSVVENFSLPETLLYTLIAISIVIVLIFFRVKSKK